MSGARSDFEVEYTLKFKQLVLNYGEFLQYERDQSQRDIGLHLKNKIADGSRSGASTVFFQLKGIMGSTLSEKTLSEQGVIKQQLKVKHLRNWYRYAEPTYLCVYVECIDQFYYLNIKKWVDDNFGASIHDLSEETKTISVDFTDEFKLDEAALKKMFIKGESAGWKNLVGDLRIDGKTDEEHEAIFVACLWQHNLMRRIHKIGDEGRVTKVHFRDRLSKTRSEAYFFEDEAESVALFPSEDDEQDNLFHSHWGVMLTFDRFTKHYEYLNFWQDEEADLSHGGELMMFHSHTGEEFQGVNYCYELGDVYMSCKLNTLGKKLVKWLERMENAGVIVPDYENPEFISIAGWHRKEL